MPKSIAYLWDEQLEKDVADGKLGSLAQDVADGKLGSLAQEAIADFKAGHYRAV